jgi:3-oxoacyl-[acyl-carrier protein] reductase
MTAAINPEVYDIIMKTIPMGRAGKPEEIASAAVYLLSEGAAYVTRQVIEIDGGM